MELLGKDLIIRGKVADLTAKATNESGHKEIVLKCYTIIVKLQQSI